MTMSGLSNAAYNFIKKYSMKLEDAAKREHNFFGRVARRDIQRGSDWNYSLRDSNVQNIGTITQAIAAARGGPSGVRYQVPIKVKYQGISVDGVAMAMSGDMGALHDLLQENFDSALEEFTDAFAFDLFRDGSGMRGRRSGALISTNTVQLGAGEARNFKINMDVEAGPSADGSSKRTGDTYVTAVDESLEQITLNSAAAISGFLADDYLFRKSESASANTNMEGFQSAIPLTPSASFRGIDQTLAPERRAGSRLTGTGDLRTDIGRLCINISTVCRRLNKPVALCHPIDFWEVATDMAAQVSYTTGGDGTSHFASVMVATPAGTVELLSDADVPLGYVWVGDESTAYLIHCFPVPHIIMDDSLKVMRSGSADGVDGRARGIVNLVIPNPSKWGVLDVA